MDISKESYLKKMNFQVDDLWKQRNEGYIRGKSDKKLYWVSLTSKQHEKAIIVVNGRIESAWKYQEVFYDLYSKGYDVYSYDHRGQGLSDRLTEDKQIGHVEHFSDYVTDMATVIDHFQLHDYQQRFILAHSMGGAIATRYLQNDPKTPFDAIALSAPMFGVNLEWYLRPIAKYLTATVSYFFRQPFYISKNKAYYAKPFESNPLTSSFLRYSWFRELYESKPELKLGGPSARWVSQSLISAENCIRHAEKINIPLLLIQGEEDKIVNNKDHISFIKKNAKTNPNCEFVSITACKHEILFESAPCRENAFNKVLSFFQKNKRGK